MPHNRGQREATIRAKYEFVVFGGEYGLQHVLLAAIDAIITGGNTTFEYLKDEVKQFGIDLASSLAAAGINPATEPLYVDKMIFENWEKLPWGGKFDLPNKFVPYVAAKKRNTLSPIPQNIPPQPNAQEPGPITYVISVTTAPGIPSGTGSNAFIVLHGTLGSSVALPLHGSGPIAGRFLPGSTTETSFTLPDLGTINGITIGHDNTGLSPNWLVESVGIKKASHGYVVPVGQWIGGDHSNVCTYYC